MRPKLIEAALTLAGINGGDQRRGSTAGINEAALRDNLAARPALSWRSVMSHGEKARLIPVAGIR